MSGTLQKITWSALLFLVLFCTQSLCCLKCDSTAKGIMQTFNYMVKNEHGEDEEAYIKLKRFVSATSKKLMEEIDGMFLDQQAIFEITSAYKQCVELIESGNYKGAQFMSIIGTQFKRLKEKFTGILAKFSKRVCPNKKGEVNCGIMMQKFTECHSCEEEKLVCVGGPSMLPDWFDKCGCYCTSEKSCQDLQTGESCRPCENSDHYFNSALLCGERTMEIQEDDDLILDCTLVWHAKLEDKYQYVFYKKSDLSPMLMTEEPFFVKKEVQMNDSDVYICRTQLLSRIPVSIITYNVKVVKMATKEYKPRPTLPYIALVTPHTAASLDSEEIISSRAQIAIFACGFFIIVVISALSIYLFQKTEIIKKKDMQKQKEYMEEMLLLSTQ